MDDSPVVSAAAHWCVRRFWRPPGVDLMSIGHWQEVFAPVLEDTVVRERLGKLDRTFRSLPGFEGLAVMGQFLPLSDPIEDRLRRVLSNPQNVAAGYSI